MTEVQARISASIRDTMVNAGGWIVGLPLGAGFAQLAMKFFTPEVFMAAFIGALIASYTWRVLVRFYNNRDGDAVGWTALILVAAPLAWICIQGSRILDLIVRAAMAGVGVIIIAGWLA